MKAALVAFFLVLSCIARANEYNKSIMPLQEREHISIVMPLKQNDDVKHMANKEAEGVVLHLDSKQQPEDEQLDDEECGETMNRSTAAVILICVGTFCFLGTNLGNAMF